VTSERGEAKPGELFAELVAIMARLRSPEGCPWDRAQDHRTLRRYLLEESYEVLEAIDRGDPEELCGELGDLLLQVVFQAQVAAEQGEFTISEVIQTLRDKLVARHPHVFGDLVIETPEAVVTEWESIKRRERRQTPAEQVMGVPRDLPALARAQAVLRKAARAGAERSADEVVGALEGALERLSSQEAGVAEAALGDVLLAVADLARRNELEAEQALRERVNRLVREVGGGG
jgi:tetrapyrrole methylase family protein/MazG family protein